MASIYYAAMIVGVAWLAVWAALPEGHARFGWWPFDLRETTPPDAKAAPAPAPADAPAPRPAAGGGWRARAAASRSGRGRA
jgi:hypothetical protein